MEFRLDDALALLSRTPATLNTLLRDAPDEWTMQNNGGDTWSPWAVVGHLVHGEEHDWISRIQTLLEYGESRAFDPFDREGMFEKYKGITLPDLLDRFAKVRAANLETVRGMKLTDEDIAKRGLHPSLGPVRLSNLLSTWVTHDFNHTGQIVEVMARHYKEAVGPWIQYLNILTRET